MNPTKIKDFRASDVPSEPKEKALEKQLKAQIIINIQHHKQFNLWKRECKEKQKEKTAKALKAQAEDIFNDIENNCNLWTSADIVGSPEAKSNDKWLSMNIIKKLKQKHGVGK